MATKYIRPNETRPDGDLSVRVCMEDKVSAEKQEAEVRDNYAQPCNSGMLMSKSLDYSVDG